VSFFLFSAISAQLLYAALSPSMQPAISGEGPKAPTHSRVEAGGNPPRWAHPHVLGRRPRLYNWDAFREAPTVGTQALARLRALAPERHTTLSGKFGMSVSSVMTVLISFPVRAWLRW
jgi:hypothetical protein